MKMVRSSILMAVLTGSLTLAAQAQETDESAMLCEPGAESGDCSRHNDSPGRVLRHNAVVGTESYYVGTRDRLPENSERLLPDETFTLWVSDEIANLLRQDELEQGRRDGALQTALDQDARARGNSGVPSAARINQKVNKVYFESGFSNISDRFSTQMQGIIDYLRDKRVTRIKFIGHADKDPLSDRAEAIYRDNQGLSEARAGRVARYFQNRLELPPHGLLVEGRADREPVASNFSESGKALNRRVEIQVWYAKELPKPVVAPRNVVKADEPQKRLKVCRAKPMCYERLQAQPVERIKVRNPIPPIRFASGKADLRPEFVQQLKAVLQAFSDKPNVAVRFVGHTDSEPLSDNAERIFKDNLGLSFARAREVATYFQSRMQLDPTAIVIDGRSEWEPVAPNENRRGMALNRRVDVEIWHDSTPAMAASPIRECTDGRTPNDGLMVTERFYRNGEVELADPFAMGDFRISIDGESLDGGAVHTADVQRCTDVALENAALQVQYDSLNVEPRLNVTAWPLTPSVEDAPETPWNDNVVTFQAYSNYSAFFEVAEVRLYTAHQALSSPPLYIINLNSDLRGQWAIDNIARARLGDEARYVLRTYDKKGRFDETRPQSLWLDKRQMGVANSRDYYTDVDTELLAGYGESRLALQNIPLSNAGTVTVNGVGLPQDHRVWVMDELVPVAADGQFVSQRIIPNGLNQVEVAVLDREGSGEIFWRDLALKQSDWFFVGIADITIGVDDTNGPAELVTQDSHHYDSDFFADGRLAFYAKGKTRSGVKVTASADTREQPLEDLFTNFNHKDPQLLFRRLDQDRYYPTYGDDSTVVEDAPTQGKFYVKVEKNENYAMWGNYELKLTDTELAQIDRSLYGMHLHYESDQQLSFGEDQTQIDVFAAEPGTQNAREEFRGTGGSLYYLRHQDITIGSERIRIEIRDRDSGIVAQTRELTAGQDYDIDPLAGHIILHAPLPATADDSQLIRADSLSGNPVFLVARYEFSPGFEDLDDVAAGARVSHWFGKNLKFGVTYSDIDQTGGDQQMGGVDLTWRSNSGSYVKLDFARTEGPGTGEQSSNNGGFTFDTIDQVTNRNVEADAGRIEIGINLGRIKLNAYAQRRDEGFSAPGQLVSVDTEQYGAKLSVPLTENAKLSLKLDQKEEDRGIRQRSADADLEVNLGNGWNTTIAARHEDRDDRSLVVPATQELGERTDAAIELEYEHGESWSAFGFVQATVNSDNSRDDNDRGGIGGSIRVSDRLKLDAEISEGDSGDAGKLGLDYLWSDRTNLYLAYALENERSDTGIRARKGSVTTGFKTRYSDSLSVYGEERYTNGDVPTGLTHAYGVELAPSDHWTQGISVEVGTLEDNNTGAEIDRSAVSVSLGYSKGKVKYAGLFEVLEDKGDIEDRKTYLAKNSFNLQVSANWRFLGKLNWSKSDSSRGEFFDGDFAEVIGGYAYRPVDNDRVNTLMKYTYFFNLPPSQQEIGNSRTSSDFVQRSHIISADIEYDISTRFTVGGKYGYRHGEVSLLRDNPEYFDSRAHLVVIRGEWHVVRHWDALIEARLLDLPDAEDSKAGILAAVYRHFGPHLKMGVGYNFTDFSDDLTDLDFDSQGLFFNALGKL